MSKSIDQLQQENKQLKKENKILRKTLNNLKGDKASDKLVNAVNAYYEPLLQDKFDEIEELKKQLEQLQFNHDILMDTSNAEIERLNKQLAEKDKEIEKLENARNRLANTLDRLIFSSNAESYKQDLRHEICEKIREYIHSKESRIEGMEFIWLLHKLDEIEQGEE